MGSNAPFNSNYPSIRIDKQIDSQKEKEKVKIQDILMCPVVTEYKGE